LTQIHAVMTAALAARLRAEVTRLRGELAAARLESANRLAAMRAALGADADGEADPLAYIRDEIGEYLAPGRGRR
jgi:hypothetical protein